MDVTYLLAVNLESLQNKILILLEKAIRRLMNLKIYFQIKLMQINRVSDIHFIAFCLNIRKMII